jgi:capsular exopolysaccharide synthesis family protein
MNSDTGEIKLHFLDYWRVIRVRLPLIILVFLLVVITAAVVTYFMPKTYVSTVTMQVKQVDTIINVFGQTGMGGLDPRFLTTQFEIIQRKEILYPVIDSLNLQQKWGLPSKEQAYFRLRNAVQMREIRNTELIQILVSSTDNREAMEIANRIAEEYQRKRIADSREWIDKSLAQLREEVEKQRTKVDELRTEMARIRVESGIQDLNPDSQEDPLQAETQILLSAEQQVATERMRVEALRAKHEQVSKMTDDQIMRALVTLEIQDPTIQNVLPQYQEASSEIARMLQSGLGKNHPTVKSLNAKMSVMETQLKDQISVLRRALEDNFKIAQDSLKNLVAQLEDSRSSQQTSKSKAATYYEAKNNYIQAKKLLEAAEVRLNTETMQKTMPQRPVTIWEKAEISEFPARPRVWLNIALGVVVGLVFGVGLAFFIEYLDTSVKTMEDVENFLQMPVLAVIPKNIAVLKDEKPDCPDAEAYRILRTNIEFNRKSPDANAFTIVSGGAGEGKTTTLVNLATTFAQGGYSTLIVDADLRRPAQHRLFGISNEVGLSTILMGEADLEEGVRQTSVDNLFILPSGPLPTDAVGILNSQRMVDFMDDVKNRFDAIFFDSPPILGVSDASVLASAVDLTIVVVQHRRFPRAMLQRVKNAVINVGGNLLGVVLNNVDTRHDQYYEYYTSYYNYYNRPRKGERTRAPKPTPAEASAPSVAATPRDTKHGEY